MSERHPRFCDGEDGVSHEVNVCGGEVDGSFPVGFFYFHGRSTTGL